MSQNQPLEILMVGPRKHIRGPIPYITDLLVSGLESLGCRVTLLSCWGQDRPEESVLEKIIDRIRDVIFITKQARAKHFDVVYIHSAHDMIYREILLLSTLRLTKTPAVMLFHGSRIEKLSGRKNTVFFVSTWIALKLATGLLVLSTEEEKAFKSIWPWVRCGVVPNPVKCPPINIRKKTIFQKSSRPFKLIFVGRFISAKGVLEIVEAFPKVIQKVQCELIFAGEGPLLKEMQSRIKKYGLDDKVTFTGYLDREKMWNLYKEADVLLLPTYHPEGMPMVVLEAMANGMGVICTRIRGMADYLKEGIHALFVPPKSPDILAERIIELLSNPKILSRMHKANVEYAQEFDPVKVARIHLDVIYSLIPELKKRNTKREVQKS